MKSLSDVLGHFNEVERDGQRGRKATCPVCGHHSLAITEKGDKVLLHCWHECSNAEIVKEAGLTFQDLGAAEIAPRVPSLPSVDDKGAPLSPAGWWERKVGISWAYCQQQGMQESGNAVAFSWTDSPVKTKKYRGPDNGNKDERNIWWDKEGERPPLWPTVPEKLPERIFLTEGESDCLTLRYAGYMAFAITKGAGKPPPVSVLVYLKDLGVKEIVLPYDADDSGFTGAKKAQEVVVNAGLKCMIVRPPVNPALGQKDLNDAWRSCGSDKIAFRDLFDQAIDRAAGQSSDVPWHTPGEVGDWANTEVTWIAYPWLAKGVITKFDGKVKLAGKTTFLLHMAAKIIEGKPFLGDRTRRGPVVYLTEQTPRSFVAAVDRANLQDSPDLHVMFAHETTLDWESIMRAAIRKCRETKAVLLAIDTLFQFAGVEDENSSAEAIAAMRPIQEAAALDEFAVAFTYHERKSGGDVGDSGRGSSAWAGAVDIIVQIRRPEGNSRENVRELKSVGRFDDTPASLIIELMEDGYHSHGTNIKGLEISTAKEHILRCLTDYPGQPLSSSQIRDIVSKNREVKRTTLQEALSRLEDEGKISRAEGKGHRNYYKIALPSGWEEEGMLI